MPPVICVNRAFCLGRAMKSTNFCAAARCSALACALIVSESARLSSTFVLLGATPAGPREGVLRVGDLRTAPRRSPPCATSGRRTSARAPGRTARRPGARQPRPPRAGSSRRSSCRRAPGAPGATRASPECDLPGLELLRPLLVLRVHRRQRDVRHQLLDRHSTPGAASSTGIVPPPWPCDRCRAAARTSAGSSGRACLNIVSFVHRPSKRHPRRRSIERWSCTCCTTATCGCEHFVHGLFTIGARWPAFAELADRDRRAAARPGHEQRRARFRRRARVVSQPGQIALPPA